MEITIGMKRERIAKLRDELAEALNLPEDRTIDIALYGHGNVGGGEVIVHLGNDDMERDEVSVDEIYVDVDED